MSLRDRLRRRAVPRLIVAISTVDAHRRWAAVARRALGGSARIRLYVAFDDPHSAVALLSLTERLDGRRARLVVEPVVRRGIEGDPAVDDKRRYAIIDARRLARRQGLELARTVPVAPESTAFLTEAAAAIGVAEARAEFSTATMRRLWLESNGPPSADDFAALLDEHRSDGSSDGQRRVARAERSMSRRGLYDTPIAVVHGQWFFAHERLDQIEHRLDELGFGRGA